MKTAKERMKRKAYLNLDTDRYDIGYCLVNDDAYFLARGNDSGTFSISVQ